VSTENAPSDDDVLAAYPALPVDAQSVEFYRGLLEHKLLLNRCSDCGTWHHPPRVLCPHCWSFAVAPTECSGRGDVYMFTAVHGADATGPTRTVIVTANLDDGRDNGNGADLRFTAPLAGDEAELVTGARVTVDFVQQGDGVLPAFRLVAEGGPRA
jgi:uncharacterized OB-fold protein